MLNSTRKNNIIGQINKIITSKENTHEKTDDKRKPHFAKCENNDQWNCNTKKPLLKDYNP